MILVRSAPQIMVLSNRGRRIIKVLERNSRNNKILFFCGRGKMYRAHRWETAKMYTPACVFERRSQNVLKYKKINLARPCEHPPVREGKCQNVSLFE